MHPASYLGPRDDDRASDVVLATEREMCPWAISKYFGDLVSNTSA